MTHLQHIPLLSLPTEILWALKPLSESLTFLTKTIYNGRRGGALKDFPEDVNGPKLHDSPTQEMAAAH